MAELRRLGVTIMTSARAVEIDPDSVTFEKEGQLERLPVDAVVIATGSKSETAILSEVTGLVTELHTIGDAKEPRDALEAIKEGFLTALKI